MGKLQFKAGWAGQAGIRGVHTQDGTAARRQGLEEVRPGMGAYCGDSFGVCRQCFLSSIVGRWHGIYLE